MHRTITATSLTEELRQLPVEQAARRLEELVRAAGEAGAGVCTAADRAAIQVLDGDYRADELVARLPLTTLAALAERCAHRLQHPAEESAFETRQDTWRLLDVLRQSQILCRIAAANAVPDWMDRIIALIDSSHFTFGQLLPQRCARYGGRTMLRLPGTRGKGVTWQQVAGRVDLIARGLQAVTRPTAEAPLALLSENRLEMALVDLACLSSGLVNVVIPATASDSDVAFILRHSGARAVVLSSAEQLRKVLNARDDLPDLKTIVAFDRDAGRQRGVLPYEAVLERAGEVSAAELSERRLAMRIDDLATVMYTSGTTGTPKGIMFSQRNIVSKRFARALALPEIGESDRFLCYLPLFHTFGRFLELCGCVFWGATYCFAESPAIDSLVADMVRLEPSVLISIPLKWMQLYEQIRAQVDVETAGDDEVLAVTRRVTGAQLRWGLSAAGYLDPAIFRFFQRQGIELMSGFGMTEATGGITMTPPGDYREDTLGVGLPGIELRLADDGELLIRGPYVMLGHLRPPADEPSFDAEGWFHTGDLMECDAGGYLRIIDRKKEIYKNIKGQTIAPQKIENLFRDLDSVARVFLVGDHRSYNTALIYPSPEAMAGDLAGLQPEELQAHFRSLVVSANQFLAPYERIVDFALIDRDLDAERGELTAKGSYRRREIERSFADTIALLYRRTAVTVGSVVVEIPNWLFQVLGITTQDLRVEGNQLRLASPGTSLTVQRIDGPQLRLGSVLYRCDSDTIDLGLLLNTPRLWVGNQELVAFAPFEQGHRLSRRSAEDLVWERTLGSYEPCEADRQQLVALSAAQEIGLGELHLTALCLSAPQTDDALLAVRVLDHLLDHVEGPAREVSEHLLRRLADCGNESVVRRAFQVLLPVEHPQRYQRTVARFLETTPQLLDGSTISVLVARNLPEECLDALLVETERRCREPWPLTRMAVETATSLLQLLSDYGTAHPTRYRRVRSRLAGIAQAVPTEELAAAVAKARQQLQSGFRRWLGEPARVAVDPETGREYRWFDVIEMADGIDEETRQRLLSAFSTTALLTEGLFLFSSGSLIRLEDILPGGIWVRLLAEDHGKAVLRVTVQTRHRGHYDLAINLNRSLPAGEVLREVDCLAACSEPGERGPLVETFGGYWPEYDLWTEEFIPGENLEHALQRLARQAHEAERLQLLWPFAAWSAMSAFIDLWDRIGEANPSPRNVCVPLHDYHRGALLVSISGRRRFTSIVDLLLALKAELVAPVERAHPQLADTVDHAIACAAVLDTVGPERGLRLLQGGVELLAGTPDVGLGDAIGAFLSEVEEHGFIPRRLYFAIERYRRWARLNPAATAQARAHTLQEVEGVYHLYELQPAYPEVRARLFRNTVFADAGAELSERLDRLIGDLRSGEITADELSTAVADLRAQLALESGDDDYFLARLSYPYLRPEDHTMFVPAAIGGMLQSEMVVSLTDSDGQPYRIRHALSAKEVGRLHQLFLAAKLQVQLRPEHRFLVAINERDLIIGGLFYEIMAEEQTAHLGRIVVGEPFRAKGVAGALIEELCNRLRTSGLQSLTAGFFRPQFFYRYGFTIERRYAGLVRSLVNGEGPAGGANGGHAQAART